MSPHISFKEVMYRNKFKYMFKCFLSKPAQSKSDEVLVLRKEADTRPHPNPEPISNWQSFVEEKLRV